MRRLVWLGLLVILLLSLTACATSWQGEFGEGLSWSLDFWGNLRIEGQGAIPDYSMTDDEKPLDDEYNGSRPPWIMAERYISSIEIGEGITEIGDEAFALCMDVKSVSLPDSLTRIGWRSFLYCEKLKNIIFPDSLTEIGWYAFAGCSSLTEVRLPEQLTELGAEAFRLCTKLRQIYLPEGISAHYFYGCINLESIILAEAHTQLSVQDGVLFNYDKTELLRYPPGKKDTVYTVPDGVKIVGYASFSDADSLEKIFLPDGVETIEDYAFLNCSALRVLDLPASITEVRDYAFSESGLVEITLPDHLTALGEGLFHECASLEQVQLPVCLEEIPDGLFSNCAILREVVIPENVEGIGMHSFSYCDELETLHIPAKAWVYEAAIHHCDNLQEITVDEDSPYFYTIDGVLFGDGRPFGSNGSTLLAYPAGKRDKTYVIPDGVVRLGQCAFSGTRYLEWVTLPDPVRSLGPSVFYDSRRLTGIIFGTGVTTVPSCFFWKCSRLKEIFVTDQLVTIEDDAFSEADSLRYITYTGTEEQWNAIEICDGNEALSGAEIIFGAN